MSEINYFLKQRPTINPYRYSSYQILKSLNQIVNRLRWDLNPESWRSRSIITSWKDKYAGHKAVIVCNGPSLLKTDFSLLENVFTFGLNKINLLFDKSNFRPSCIVAVNSFVIEQNADFYNQTNIPLFLSSVGTKLIKSRENVAFMHSASQAKFAQDCAVSICEGGTVTFVAMQLAFHMGFKEVALIGCDHNFTTKGKAGKTVVSGEQDDNHFDPRYFSGGVKWQLPDLAKSELSYSLARDIYYSYGRKLVNATEGGKLELLPRISLIDFLKQT
ncbi:MAG: DUF115 domain-containing protein [Xenococcaceae cyanobacterium MO_188.B32]|nr:DUF115 domain-containing protein [Xenococcaceae cyanobacterium MO_188.B32]